MNKQNLKNELIIKRKELLESFFYFFSKRKQQMVKDIDKQLDQIEMIKANDDHKKLQDLINKSNENSKRLDELLKKL